jgi:hypothetical protein
MITYRGGQVPFLLGVHGTLGKGQVAKTPSALGVTGPALATRVGEDLTPQMA